MSTKKTQHQLEKLADELRTQIEARQVPLKLGTHEIWVWWDWEGVDDHPEGDEVYVDFNGEGGRYASITLTLPTSQEDEEFPQISIMPRLSADETRDYLRALAGAQTWHCHVGDEDQIGA